MVVCVVGSTHTRLKYLHCTMTPYTNVSYLGVRNFVRVLHQVLKLGLELGKGPTLQRYKEPISLMSFIVD